MTVAVALAKVNTPRAFPPPNHPKGKSITTGVSERDWALFYSQIDVFGAICLDFIVLKIIPQLPPMSLLINEKDVSEFGELTELISMDACILILVYKLSVLCSQYQLTNHIDQPAPNSIITHQKKNALP